MRSRPSRTGDTPSRSIEVIAAYNEVSSKTSSKTASKTASTSLVSTGLSPTAAWLADGWLPRTTDNPEQLDLLLVMVAAPRVVHRDGIRFQGVRYLDPTLAAYVGEAVTIRYDPRDLAEIRVYHRDTFVCRAISPEHASQTVTLKDIQAARVAHRRALRAQLDRRHAAVKDYLPSHGHSAAGETAPASPPAGPAEAARPAKQRLFTYHEDLP